MLLVRGRHSPAHISKPRQVIDGTLNLSRGIQVHSGKLALFPARYIGNTCKVPLREVGTDLLGVTQVENILLREAAVS